MDPIRDWFGLLNYGYRITGVGSSDTHYVSRMILGQARSYVLADDQDPANLDVKQIIKSYREGRVLVSMGLLVNMTVNDQFHVGDLATGIDGRVKIAVDVTGPRWDRATREDPFQLKVYINGYEHFSKEKKREKAASVKKMSANFELSGKKLPKHDFWMVAVATGLGVTAPFWAIPRPYQPSSKTLNPRVIAVTNPIRVDADGDGKFTSARGYAMRLIKEFGGDLKRLNKELTSYDQAVAAQITIHP